MHIFFQVMDFQQNHRRRFLEHQRDKVSYLNSMNLNSGVYLVVFSFLI